jgi:polyhydroxyalkanoate synthesis repressor PhaR
LWSLTYHSKKSQPQYCAVAKQQQRVILVVAKVRLKKYGSFHTAEGNKTLSVILIQLRAHLPMNDKIMIKKYSNRRLYDMDQKGYITLEELRDKIRNGYEVQVIDSKTGEDLTQSILIQIILETEKQQTDYLFNSEFLHQLIQYREDSMTEFFQKYLPNILRSYIHWQQEAQNQFLHWASFSWNTNQYSRDFFNFWGGSRPPQTYAPFPNGASQEELEGLKQKVEELETQLKKSRNPD